MWRSLRQQLPRGFESTISCAGSELLPAGACDGNSGGPLIRRVSSTARDRPYYEQHFLVSAGVDCDLEATLYTRITSRKILTWIQRLTDTSPLVMVAGGYNADAPNGLLHDVELVSPTPGNLCSKRVRPLPGRRFDLVTHVEKESATLGLTGQVAHDAAMVCGGRTGEGYQVGLFIGHGAERNSVWNSMTVCHTSFATVYFLIIAEVLPISKAQQVG